MADLRQFNISRGDLWIVTSAHSNVLIEGPEAAIALVVGALKNELREPLLYWDGEPPKSVGGTLVVRAVDSLDADGQRRLLDYLARSSAVGAVQVVSTSAQPVFPLIDRGLFLEDLYYRLNTVLLSLDGRR